MKTLNSSVDNRIFWAIFNQTIIRRPKMQQQNLSETIANQCIAAICDEMAHQYGYYYITDENSKRKWCEKLQYHDDANQAAIECARRCLGA